MSIADQLQVRESLERLGAAGAARCAAKTGREPLGRLLVLMGQSESIANFLAIDTEFHITISQLSGNALAPVFMEALRGSIARQMLAAFERVADWPTERASLTAEHRLIAERIWAGDAEGAADAVTKHINGFYSRVRESVNNR